MSLKQKTVKSVIWSIGGQFAKHGTQFILQIILARLLLPEDFGKIGMILVFILISNIMIDSGFSQALIREQKVDQADYSTVFYFNLAVSFFLYGILYVSAPSISVFFNESQLVPLLRVLSLCLIINALSIIQRTLLTKNIDFKTQTKIVIISGLLSGAIAIISALLGLGVWSLVIKTVSLQLFQSILLWVFNDWRPSLVFQFESIKRLFGFGSRLMIAGVISIIYSNIYYVVIGKMYPIAQLGYYTNAAKITEPASLSITAALQKVTYPVLSTIQDEEERLKHGFRKIIRISAFINFPLMVGLAAIADPFVQLLFGEKWIPMVIYFQMLCIAGMLNPIHEIDLNILQVKGKSSLFLKLSIARKIILTVLIVGAVLLNVGVIGLIFVAVIQSYIEFFIISFFSGREISYSTGEQIRDLLPIYIITIIMGAVVYVSGMLLPENNMMKIIVQIVIGTATYIGISKLVRLQVLKVLVDLLSPILQKGKARKHEKVYKI